MATFQVWLKRFYRWWDARSTWYPERTPMKMEIEQLMEAIDDIVRFEGTWQEKKEKILESITEDQKTSLFEFVAWFD